MRRPTSATGIACGVLFAVVVAFATWHVFAPAASFDFVMFDDDINIYQNPHLGAVDARRVSWAFTDSTFMHRFMPLSWLTLCAVLEARGLEPGVYHALNIGLHVANAVLLYLLIRRLVRIRLGEDVNANLPAVPMLALGAALFWAVHPLRVEPVCWASGILYLQAAFWALGATWCYITALSATRCVAALLLSLSLAAYVCSVLTYPVTLGWPAVLVAIEWWLTTTVRPAADIPLARWRLMLLGACGAVALFGLGLAVRARTGVTTYWTPPPGFAEFSLLDRLLNAAYAAAYYIGANVWPRQWSPVYEPLLNSPDRWIGVGVIAMATAGGIWAARRAWARAASCLVIAYVGVSAPFYGLLDSGFEPADRYTYVSGVVVVGAVAIWAAGLHPRMRTVATVVLVAAVAFCVLLTRSQMTVWRDSRALFARLADTLANPDRRAAYIARDAVYVARLGDFERAHALMEQARAGTRNPRDLGLYQVIIDSLRESAAKASSKPVVPAAAEAHAYALQAAKAGNDAAAAAFFSRALHYDAEFLEARYNFALWLARKGEVSQSLPHYLRLENAGGAFTRDLRERLLLELVRAYRARGEDHLADACERRRR